MKLKTIILIDGSNNYATQKNLGVDMDFRDLLVSLETERGTDLFACDMDIFRAYYFTAITDDQEYSSIRPLVDFLDYNGYTLITKPTKEFTDSSGRRKIKGNMDIELCVTAFRLIPHADHFIIFSGDGDFASLAEYLKDSGKRVSVVSTLKTQPPMIADDLRRAADKFVDFADLSDMMNVQEESCQKGKDDGPQD